MCNKLCALIVVGGLALLTALPVSLACDKDKQVVAQTGASQVTVAQVADAPACWKSRQAAATVAVVDTTESNPVCAKTQTMKLLAKAIMDCSPDCVSRANVVAAYRTMAKANPALACNKLLASFDPVVEVEPVDFVLNIDKASQCRAAKRAAKLAAVGGAYDAAACAKAKARATQVAGAAFCDPAACARARAVQASNAVSACSASKQAKYVAYGCKKTDKVARAAARAYIQLMSELKDYSGAEGCSAQAASQVLTAVLADMRAERTAQAAVVVEVEPVVIVEVEPVVIVEVEPVANIETSVSFGAVSETKKSSCRYSKK